MSTPYQGDLTASGPIYATTGQLIRGLRVTGIGTGTGASAVFIPPGVTDVTIEDCYLTAPGASDTCHGVYILPGASRITIRRTHIDDVSTGIYAAGATHPIWITENLITRVRGPLPRGQGIQFNGVKQGLASSIISRNTFDVPIMVEDWISMYDTYGSTVYPIIISENRLRGGGRRVLDANGDRIWEASGSGIMTADHGGAHYDILRNLVVLTQNTGIGTAGGHDVRIIGNVICNAGPNADSQTRSALIVNTYVGNVPTRVLVKDNRCVAFAWLGTGRGELAQGIWDDGTAIDLVYENNLAQDLTLTPAIWDDWTFRP